MKGVSNLSERAGFFQPIVDSNTDGIAKVYTAAEALFAQLGDEVKKYQVRGEGGVTASPRSTRRPRHCLPSWGMR